MAAAERGQQNEPRKMKLRSLAIGGVLAIWVLSSLAVTVWMGVMREAERYTAIIQEQKILTKQVEVLDATVGAAEEQWRGWSLGTLRPVIATAYNSVSWQTDDDPWITASGEVAGSGTIALSRDLIRAENEVMEQMGYNLTAEISFGDTVYLVYVLPMVVHDTMHRRYRDRADVWTADIELARAWGVRRAFLAY